MFENYVQNEKERAVNKTTAQGITNVSLKMPRIIMSYA